jgi:uncharacterized protein (DUF1499 family)
VQEQDGPRRALHAVVATPWLRFKDDLRISVEAASGGGSNVNVSSRSRVGRADFGANLSHVMRFYQTLEAVAGSS